MHKPDLNRLNIILAASSLALVLIVWNLFSSKALDDALKQAEDQNQPQTQPGSTLSNLTPLSTLNPVLFSLASETTRSQEPTSTPLIPTTPVAAQPTPVIQPTQVLRKVSAPIPVSVSKTPMVNRVVVDVYIAVGGGSGGKSAKGAKSSGGGGGGGGGGGRGGGGAAASVPAPVASTGSSRP
jgi:uncharacterized membrane protein YgcG